MTDGAPPQAIEDTASGAGTLEWRARYDGLVSVALLGGKAVAGISGPWSGKFALTWWDRPLPARRLELFDSAGDARAAVERWAERIGRGIAVPARVDAAPPRPRPGAGLLGRVRALLAERARAAAPRRAPADRLRCRCAGEPDLSGLHFAAHD